MKIEIFESTRFKTIYLPCFPKNTESRSEWTEIQELNLRKRPPQPRSGVIVLTHWGRMRERSIYILEIAVTPLFSTTSITYHSSQL